VVGAAALLGAAAAPGIAHGASVRVTPGLLDVPVRAGTIGQVVVANPGRTAINVTVGPRKWGQGRGGVVRATTRRLAGVSVSPSSFALAAGARRVVTIRVSRRPAAGFLYGALVTRAVDRTRGRRPVSVAAAVVSSIRLRPNRAVRRVQVGAPSARRSRGRVVIRVPLRNSGNQVSGITGGIQVRVGRRVRPVALRRVTLLPGASLTVSSASAALPRGRFSYTVFLAQDGRAAGARRGQITIR
jgi:hypothetical protein